MGAGSMPGCHFKDCFMCWKSCFFQNRTKTFEVSYKETFIKQYIKKKNTGWC